MNDSLHQNRPIQIQRPGHSCYTFTETMPKTYCGLFTAKKWTCSSCTLCICEVASASNRRAGGKGLWRRDILQRTQRPRLRRDVLQLTRRPTTTSAVTSTDCDETYCGHAPADAAPDTESPTLAVTDAKRTVGSHWGQGWRRRQWW